MATDSSSNSLICVRAGFARLSLVIFLIALCVFSARSQAQSLTPICESLFAATPRAIGNLDQNDAKLKRAGLFPANQRYSQLCGPVCFINLLHEIRMVLGLTQRAAIGELMYVVKKVGPSIGVSTKHVRNSGMAAFQLSELMQAYLQQLGIKARVTVKGVEVTAATMAASGKSNRTSIAMEDLASSSKRFVIINYEGWRTKDIASIEATNPSTGWLGGHYVIAESLTPGKDGSAAIRIHDPRGGIRDGFELVPFNSQGLGIQTMQVKFPPYKAQPPNPAILDLITNIVIIELVD